MNYLRGKLAETELILRYLRHLAVSDLIESEG